MTTLRTLTPPTTPLPMPTQVLSEQPRSHSVRSETHAWLARVITFGGSLALTVLAAYQMSLVVPLAEAVDTSSPVALLQSALMWLLLGLFTVTFGWISLSATAAVAGLLSGRSRYHADPAAPLQGRTVLLMPIYNEDAVSACASLAAMGDELGRMGLQEHFEIFVISDTNDPDIIPDERAAVEFLRDTLAGVMPVWYRRRDRNTDRKAGNIRDFINRWGRAYDYMVVLDADSLMAGDTLATLVREMDADSAAGILQTLPRQFGGSTLFARLQQFAGFAYGPVFARGLSAWQGEGGNYWGHNAIIRIRAFAESAGLPALSGPKPFGGEIRSHDFVEAALIRRAGWSVRMLPALANSWEECPPTLLDTAVRDRRWAQGNVQHMAVVTARGIRWQNRVHMLMGVMNYLTSLLWLLMVAAGLVLSTRFALQLNQGVLAEQLPAYDMDRMYALFGVTMGLLLLPKLIGLVGGLVSHHLYGLKSRLRFLLSALIELVFSVLHAPILMLIHSRHLWEIVRGHDSGWSAQKRRVNRVNWRLLLARHRIHTVLGLMATGLLIWLSTDLLIWMMPIIVGLVLAIPLSALSGSEYAANWTHRLGLLRIPEEDRSPAIMAQRQAFLATCRSALNDQSHPYRASKAYDGKFHPYGSYGEKQPQYGRL